MTSQKITGVFTLNKNGIGNGFENIYIGFIQLLYRKTRHIREAYFNKGDFSGK